VAASPFNIGDPVVWRDDRALKGVVTEVVQDSLDGDSQVLVVRWEGGRMDQVLGNRLFSGFEKRGLGRDVGRCAECGMPTGSGHLSTCSRG
jgi:hypothetical protein